MKKNKYILRWIPVGLLILLALGCIDKFDAHLSHDKDSYLVIEGNIVSDSVVVFQLSRSLPLRENADNTNEFQTFQEVDGEVVVKGSDGSSWKGESRGKGEYAVAIGTLQKDVEYSLEVVCDGATYTSQPQRPLEASGIESVDYSQPDPEGPVELRVTTGMENSDDVQYHLWFFKEDWEVRAAYHSKYWYDYETGMIRNMGYPKYAQGWCYNGVGQFIAASTVSLAENRWVDRLLHSIDSDDHRISCLYSFRFYQRNLTKREYEYYQIRIKSNEEMGGLFAPQPSELPTNIICSDPERKVIGYIGCNMAVDYRQVYIAMKDINYTYETAIQCAETNDGTPYENYVAGKQVTRTEHGVFWADLKCVDVRYWGANPDGRPEWWPNPYLYK